MTIAARPTTYNGIRMRSRLEARFAAFLDRTGLEWEYEPRAFASEKGQYLPDFRIIQGGCRGDLYVEIKGAGPEDDVLAALIRMRIIHSSEPQASLACFVHELVEPGARQGFVLPGRGYDWLAGGFGLCRVAQPHFFALQGDEPVQLRHCSHQCHEQRGIAVYINPFGQS